MADKKEEEKETQPAEITGKPDGKDGGWEGILTLVKTFLPAIGVFGALCYFLGRSYVESYYAALGIEPDVLTFTNNDYMISSFNMVIMCLVYTVLFYMYWQWYIKVGELGREPGDKEIPYIRVSVVAAIWLASVAYVLLFHLNRDLYWTGISGLATGLLFGSVFIIPAFCVEPRAAATIRTTLVVIIFAFVVVIFSFMPHVTKDLAEVQANSEMEKFAPVNIISSVELPPRLRKSAASPYESREVGMVITNNEMTYVMLDEGKAGEWHVYAIPVDNIEHIIYVHDE